jgi:hypothetical protein
MDSDRFFLNDHSSEAIHWAVADIERYNSGYYVNAELKIFDDKEGITLDFSWYDEESYALALRKLSKLVHGIGLLKEIIETRGPE